MRVIFLIAHFASNPIFLKYEFAVEMREKSIVGEICKEDFE
jgi:hypothetical protein